MPVSSYLAFPPLPNTRRYFSVALSLGSPPAVVNRYSALRSPDFPRIQLFSFVRATVQSAHYYYLTIYFYFCQHFDFHFIVKAQNDSITVVDGLEGYGSGGITAGNKIYIVKVVGYKEV